MAGEVLPVLEVTRDVRQQTIRGFRRKRRFGGLVDSSLRSSMSSASRDAARRQTVLAEFGNRT